MPLVAAVRPPVDVRRPLVDRFGAERNPSLEPVEAGARADPNRAIVSNAATHGAKRRQKMQGRKSATVIAALLAGMTLVTAAPAVAQEPESVSVYGQVIDAQAERVAFADLNLARLSDQKRLHHRVGGAIERVCQIDLGRDGLQDKGFYSCAEAAWGGAAPQIAEALATGKTSLGAAILVVGR